MIDSHFHSADNLSFLTHLAATGVQGIVNSQTPAEFALLQKWQSRHPDQGITLSAGVHPWDADHLTAGKMRPILQQVPVIGEIGLDAVWTKNSLSQQRPVFVEQLAWARDWHKPVILHTKGVEHEILETIRQFPNRYYIHWYDSDQWLPEYLRLDTYFSVGPSLGLDPVVNRLAAAVPLDRLLLESDGWESIHWASRHPITTNQDYDAFMARLLTQLAALRGLTPLALAAQLTKNLQNFLHQP
ncbi:MAG: TatD family hydrolase [Schleiferilactobacillus perolens]|uniref:TatD family hydrolase n=1 Tax=Schleiferilactobacillus perolens TaxID=100468 RepID=UPI0039E85060